VSTNISAITKDWLVSRPYVSRCVNHRGCPTSSLADAQEWRECYASKRANQKRLAQQTDEQGDTNPAEDNTLIPLATAKEIAFHGYDFILGLVEPLPENAAAQCNPENPQIAFAVLKSEYTYILCNAYEGVRRVVESRAAYLHGGKYGMIPRCV
jgi:hypothetical protein